MFVFLMESASWFAWPGNAIASVQVLMTRMIDFRMSLAVNSLLFFSFTKSFVTWVMAVVPLAQLFEFFESVNLLPYLWMLNVLPEFLCCIFYKTTTTIFWPDINFHFIFHFFIRLGILSNCSRIFAIVCCTGSPSRSTLL